MRDSFTKLLRSWMKYEEHATRCCEGTWAVMAFATMAGTPASGAALKAALHLWHDVTM